MPKLFETTSLRAGDPMIFSLTPDERDQICLNCPLAQCVGLKSNECPIVIEQRRRWREKYRRRTEAGYFAARDRKQKAEKAGRTTINA